MSGKGAVYHSRMLDSRGLVVMNGIGLAFIAMYSLAKRLLACLLAIFLFFRMDSSTEAQQQLKQQPEANHEQVKAELNDNEKQLLKQIDFYFSDANLSRDKFIQRHLSLNSGSFDISTLLSFNRVKSFTTCPDMVARVVESSETLVLDPVTRSSFSRCVPFIPTSREDWSKSVHVSGITVQENVIDSVQQVLQDRFGQVTFVQVLRDEERLFKGEALVEFVDAQAATACISASPVSLSDATLEIIPKYSCY